MDFFCFYSVLCLQCLCARLFICALWSPAGKGLTSWLSFVVSNCECVTFPLVSWVGCGTWLYRFLEMYKIWNFFCLISEGWSIGLRPCSGASCKIKRQSVLQIRLILFHSMEMYIIWNLRKIAKVSYSIYFTWLHNRKQREYHLLIWNWWIIFTHESKPNTWFSNIQIFQHNFWCFSN